MGIPYLFTNVQPYCEVLHVGDPKSHSTLSADPTIPSNTDVPLRVVIDGPCLVYAMYGRLINQDNGGIASFDLPTYEDIQYMCHAFLDQLEAHNIIVQRIYFDGALPAVKEPERLSRLEKSLEKLQQLNRDHRAGLGLCTVPNAEDWTTVMKQPFILWKDSPMLAAPFMVAAVKESLLRSRPSQVSTVNDEADRGCAYDASLTGCHILTSDTDLLVYNIGDAAVMWLSNMNLGGGNGRCDSESLQIRYVRPQSLAKRWNLDRFSLFSYEKSRDAQQTLPVIIKRAQIPLHARNPQDLAAFEAFAGIYNPSGEMIRAFSSTRAVLDPRLSEVATTISLSGKRSPVMYMHPLLEDPSREAAWSYGVMFRALAYSCLMQSERHQPEGQRPIVIEQYRKGTKIANCGVFVPDLAVHSARLLQMILRHDNYVQKDLDMCYFWRSFALFYIQQERQNREKKLVSKDHIYKLFGIIDERVLIDWETIHLHATIEAVLYSLRMFKQSLAVVLQASSCPAILSKVAIKLDTIPEICDLHLTIAEVIQKSRRDYEVLSLQFLMPGRARELILSPDSTWQVRIAVV